MGRCGAFCNEKTRTEAGFGVFRFAHSGSPLDVPESYCEVRTCCAGWCGGACWCQRGNRTIRCRRRCAYVSAFGVFDISPLVSLRAWKYPDRLCIRKEAALQEKRAIGLGNHSTGVGASTSQAAYRCNWTGDRSAGNRPNRGNRRVNRAAGNQRISPTRRPWRRDTTPGRVALDPWIPHAWMAGHPLGRKVRFLCVPQVRTRRG